MKHIVSLFIILFLFGCSDPGSRSHRASTINDTTISGDVGFLFFGDWGHNNTGQKQVALLMENYCREKLCQFVINVGDNFYPNGVRSKDDPKWKTHFLDIYSPLKLTFYSVLGNHDYGNTSRDAKPEDRGDVQAQIDFKHPLWNMSARYYTFTKGPIEFVGLDTDPRGWTEAQRKWLEEVLKKPKNRGVDWRIVFGHHPIFSYGVHKDTPHLKAALWPAIKNQADLYLCGHEHDKQIIVKEGFPLLISGAAGDYRRTEKGPDSIFASSQLGFMHIKIRKKEAHVTVVNLLGLIEFETSFKIK